MADGTGLLEAAAGNRGPPAREAGQGRAAGEDHRDPAARGRRQGARDDPRPTDRRAGRGRRQRRLLPAAARLRCRRGPQRGDARGVPLEQADRRHRHRTFSLVLLLPFMLSNIAVWMLPVTGRDGHAGRALCRLLAATLTAMYVLSTVGVSLDLIAWQCAAYPRCLEGRREFSWLGDVPPGQRLALLAVPPIIAIVLIWRLGARDLAAPRGQRPRARCGCGPARRARLLGHPLAAAPTCARFTSLWRWARSTSLCCWLWRRTTPQLPGWLLLAADVALLAGAAWCCSAGRRLNGAESRTSAVRRRSAGWPSRSPR